MKNFFTALALTLSFALLATSCWKTSEDWSLCLPEVVDPTRLVLDFSLHETPDARFTDSIQHVEYYLFDRNRLLIESGTLDEARLREDLTVVYDDIEPGTYYALAWANVNIEEENTLRTVTDTPASSSLVITSDVTGSPVYFAPRKAPQILTSEIRDTEPDWTLFEATVVEGAITVKPMMFDKAHRTIDVFIEPEGWILGELPGDPVISRSGAGAHIDFLHRHDIAEMLTFTETMSIKMIDGQEWWTVHFHSAWLQPLEQLSGDVWIVNPRDGAPAPLTEYDLHEYVVAQRIVERYGDDSYIPIYYDINGPLESTNQDGNVNVHIELPPWVGHNVEPY
jgi:hypothetical protein